MAKINHLFNKQNKALVFADVADNTVEICFGNTTAKYSGAAAITPCLFDGEFFAWLNEALTKAKDALERKSAVLVLPDCAAFTDVIVLPNLNKKQTNVALSAQFNVLYKNASELCLKTVSDGNKHIVVGAQKSVVCGIKDCFANAGIELCGITVCGEVLAKALCRRVPDAGILIDNNRMILIKNGRFAGSIDISKYGFDCIPDAAVQNSFDIHEHVYTTCQGTEFEYVSLTYDCNSPLDILF